MASSVVTVAEYILTLILFGYLAIFIANKYLGLESSELKTSYYFFAGIILILLINQFTYTPQTGGIFYFLFNWHTIPFKFVSIVTLVALYLLYSNNYIDYNTGRVLLVINTLLVLWPLYEKIERWYYKDQSIMPSIVDGGCGKKGEGNCMTEWDVIN